MVPRSGFPTDDAKQSFAYIGHSYAHVLDSRAVYQLCNHSGAENGVFNPAHSKIGVQIDDPNSRAVHQLCTLLVRRTWRLCIIQSPRQMYDGHILILVLARNSAHKMSF